MRKSLIISGLLLGVSALFFFGKYQVNLLSSAEFKVRRLRKVSTKDGVALIGYDLEITNPSSVAITLNNLVISIFSGQEKIAEINYPHKIKIRAKGTASVPLETAINMGALLKVLSGSLKELLSAKTLGLSFIITANAQLLGLTLNKLTYKDTIKQLNL